MEIIEVPLEKNIRNSSSFYTKDSCGRKRKRREVRRRRRMV